MAIGKNAEARDLNDLDGEIFIDPETVKTTLTARAGRMIDKMVAAATKASGEWYTSNAQSDVNISNMSLEDISVDDSSDDSSVSDQVNMIELPDGRMAKVRSVKVDPNFKTGS